jgi:ABC-2 type transport system ATP-binding protein
MKMTDHDVIIRLDRVSKCYRGNPVPAINDISLSIRCGEFYGILGPNGAGKTTLILVICGLYRPTSGKVMVNGLDLHHHLKSFKRMIGIVPQDIALYPTLTVRENLRFYGQVYGLGKDQLDQKIQEYQELLELNGSVDRRVSALSGGMRRRINIIAGLLHAPSILFLDEPTAGIDVRSKRIITDYLKYVHKKGTTIIYTSHLIAEAEELCSRICIIDLGKVLLEVEQDDILQRFSGSRSLEHIYLQMTEKKDQ